MRKHCQQVPAEEPPGGFKFKRTNATKIFQIILPSSYVSFNKLHLILHLLWSSQPAYRIAVSTDEKLGVSPPGNHRITQVLWYSDPANSYGLDWSLLNCRNSWHPNSPESRTYLMAKGSQGAAVPALFYTQRWHQSYQFIMKNLVGEWLDTTQSNLPALAISSLTFMGITQRTQQPLCQPNLCRFYVYSELSVCV